MIGIIFPDLGSFYNEFFGSMIDSNKNQLNIENSTLLKKLFSSRNEGAAKVLQSFFDSKKPIGCHGYGVVGLFSLLKEDNSWMLKGYNISSVAISSECRNDYFINLPFTIEEMVRELGGSFCDGDRLIISDRNLITASRGDVTLIQFAKNLAFLMTQEPNAL